METESIKLGGKDMSGPKTSRYTLTPEQRKILAEQRQIQREIQKNTVMLKQNVAGLKEIVSKVDTEIAQFRRIVSETGKSTFEIDTLESVRNKAMQILNDAGTVSEKSGLSVMESTNKKLKEMTKVLSDGEVKMSSELRKANEEFREEINAAISEGFTISFIRIEEELPAVNMSDYTSKIDATLEEIRGFQISNELRAKFIVLKEKAAEIDSIDFIENYYAMSIIPFLKECQAYNSLFLEYGARFEELCAEYEVLVGELGVPKKQFSFSLESIEELEKEIQDMQKIIQRKEEQEYISECVDKAMQEMGYKVIGNREVVRKDGRRFTNELYLFDEGTAVNVTYSDEGQITMELGGLDDQDRIPSEAECQSLAQDMVSFCDDYLKIEEKLRAMGIVSHRVSILPPEAQFAQIINTSDYCMKEDVVSYEAKKTHKSTATQGYLRKDE